MIVRNAIATLAALSLMVIPVSAGAAPGVNAPDSEVRCLEQPESTFGHRVDDYLDSITDFPGTIDACEGSARGCMLTPAQNAAIKATIDDMFGGPLDELGDLPMCAD